MGAAGYVILFLFMLVAIAMLVLWLGSYSGHGCLTVLEQTAAGSDEVTWSDEPFVDWLAQGAHFWGPALWPTLVWLAVRSLGGTPTAQVAWYVGLFALLFPLSLLSSVSANFRWTPLRWALLQQLGRRSDAAIAFFTVSPILPAGVALAGYWLVFGEPGAAGLLLGIPVVALVSVALLIVYARLLGRLCWIIRPRTIPRSTSRPVPLPIAGPQSSPPPVHVPRPAAPKVSPAFDEETYAFQDEPTAVFAPPLLPSLVRPRDDDQLPDDDEAPPVYLPARPWTELFQTSVFFFPLYSKCLPPLLGLTLGWGLLLSLLIAAKTIYLDVLLPRL